MSMSDNRASDGNRKFYDLPSKCAVSEQGDGEVAKGQADAEQMFEFIANSEIGKDEMFISPYGYRRVVYCDYTASGRSLTFIEDFIRAHVLNEYGNTHTSSTVTSLQTTLFRNEARDFIKSCVNAGEHDCLVFVGSGCTGAVHKLINALNLTQPPVVIVSPYEHHSNLLPWRETMAEILHVNEALDGSIDLVDLENKLKMYKDVQDRVKIGSFSATSNVTGIISDVDKITILLHKYGFLSFWDYATGAAYLDMNMNPFLKDQENQELAYKDAIFLSVHKFVGGPQTPGILIAKKNLFKNRVPNGAGGGTVFFVTEKDHRYLKNDEMREEGGTPAIIESIRAGLVFQLKHAVGVHNIMTRDHHLTKKAIDFLRQISNIHLLGSLITERLPLFSFLIRHEQTGLYLHSNFVSALLNDLFGIQSRSGCACAGPYSQYLLGISYELSKTYEECLIQDERIDRHHLRIRTDTTRAEILRPGFTRFNLAYFFSESRVDFILNAVKFMCEHGWKFLPLYILNLETGEFRHRNFQVFKDRKWLGHINYKNNTFNYTRKIFNQKEEVKPCPTSDAECFEFAYKALEATKHTYPISDQRLIFSADIAKLRWFLLPSEAYGIIHKIDSLYNENVQVPFTPHEYKLNSEKVNEIYKTDRKTDKPNVGAESRHRRAQVEYSEYAQNYYSDQELEKYIRIVRQQLAEQVEESKKKFHVKSYDLNRQISAAQTSDPSNNDRSDEPTTKLTENVCKLKVKPPNSIENQLVKHEWHNPPKSIFKPFTEAVQDFEMIKNGDRLLVCLSGGKDSMSLLHAIRQYQYVARSKNIEFEFGAVTVDPKTASYNPSSLKQYLAQLNVPYLYEEQDILETAESLPDGCASICSFCSRMKRGRIYHAARKHGYNVLALGQHLDDVSESFMMSLFYNGKLWSMKGSYKNEDGDLRIIRPFVYVREKDLRAFAEHNKLPIIAENCPACFEAPKERQRMKQLLAQQELYNPCLFNSLLSAIKPILFIDKCKLSIKSLSHYALTLIKTNPLIYDEIVASNSLRGENDQTNDELDG